MRSVAFTYEHSSEDGSDRTVTFCVPLGDAILHPIRTMGIARATKRIAMLPPDEFAATVAELEERYGNKS